MDKVYCVIAEYGNDGSYEDYIYGEELICVCSTKEDANEVIKNLLNDEQFLIDFEREYFMNSDEETDLPFNVASGRRKIIPELSNSCELTVACSRCPCDIDTFHYNFKVVTYKIWNGYAK